MVNRHRCGPAALPLLVLVTPVFAIGSREVAPERVAVRTGPSSSRSSIGTALAKQDYPLLGTSGSWSKIQFGDAAGWVPSSALRTSTAPVYRVSAGPLNVRTGPGTSYRDIDEVARGVYLSVNGTSGSWRRISFEGRTAWVHSDFLDRAGSSGGSTTPTRPRSGAGLIQLRASGTGFYSYTTAYRRWGTPRMIYGIERIGRRWSGRGPKMGVGDISNMNGGKMSGHPYSHKTGKDADVRPVRDSGTGPVTIYQAAYNRTRTRALIGLFLQELPIQLIAFNDPVIYKALGKVIYAEGHHHHFHARIP